MTDQTTPGLSPEDHSKQLLYRDARYTKQYDGIWQGVGKCVFCDLKDKYLIFEEFGIVMTISLFAYIDGHFLIVPRRHVRSPKDLTQVEWDTVRKFAYMAKRMIRDVHGINSMQFVQKNGTDAQATVDQHLHFHCIPFDAPDLCEWNFRKLSHTPLENVALYRKSRKNILQHSVKYEKKYQRQQQLRLVCDAIILNGDREVLFQERTEGAKLVPDYLTLPGGGIDDFEASLEVELAREVREETSLEIDLRKLRLASSRLSKMTYARTSKPLKATYPGHNTFLWNTYIASGELDFSTMQPGDDCADFVWLSLDEITDHPRISPEVKQLFKEIAL